MMNCLNVCTALVATLFRVSLCVAILLSVALPAQALVVETSGTADPVTNGFIVTEALGATGSPGTDTEDHWNVTGAANEFAIWFTDTAGAGDPDVVAILGDASGWTATYRVKAGASDEFRNVLMSGVGLGREFSMSLIVSGSNTAGWWADIGGTGFNDNVLLSAFDPSAAYHTYQLIYDPGAATGSFYLDGGFVTATPFASFPGNGGASFFRFGNGALAGGPSSANYSLVRLESGQNPFEFPPPPLSPTHDWNFDGSDLWSNATRWSAGTVPNSNSSIVGFGNVITAPRTVTNNAAVIVQGILFGDTNPGTAQQSYTIDGSGSVTLAGDVNNSPSIFVLEGSHQFQVGVNLSNPTEVNVAGGSSLAFNSAMNLGGNTLTKMGAGTMSINGVNTGGGSVVVAGGVVNGTGTVNGDMTNSGGTVAPGLSPGTLSVTGDYLQTGGSLLIEIDGATTAGTDYDLLDVTGNLTISGGSLDVVLLTYAPVLNDSFNVLDSLGTLDLSGATIDLSLAVLDPILAWDTSQLGVDGTLSVVSAIALGDFNADGFVNTADYDIMKTNWLTGGHTLNKHGEVTGDGIVNLEDFSLFKKTLFAPASASASAVPEPNSLVLLLAVVPAWLVRRSRRNVA